VLFPCSSSSASAEAGSLGTHSLGSKFPDEVEFISCLLCFAALSQTIYLRIDFAARALRSASGANTHAFVCSRRRAAGQRDAYIHIWGHGGRQRDRCSSEVHVPELLGHQPQQHRHLLELQTPQTRPRGDGESVCVCVCKKARTNLKPPSSCQGASAHSIN